MRGEDPGTPRLRHDHDGSPPHARGRHKNAQRRVRQTRITPACAGKTSTPKPPTSARRDHPRMRGEDALVELAVGRRRGSPPHARGRRTQLWRPRFCRGITPACAGKTKDKTHAWDDDADHPRMRGEDFTRRPGTSTSAGSPPHARGRRVAETENRGRPGITPACAGKTTMEPRRDRRRGEDVGFELRRHRERGSPPHARGRRRLRRRRRRVEGITPACAGKTICRTSSRCSSTDHPRMRGEDISMIEYG